MKCCLCLLRRLVSPAPETVGDSLTNTRFSAKATRFGVRAPIPPLHTVFIMWASMVERLLSLSACRFLTNFESFSSRFSKLITKLVAAHRSLPAFQRQKPLRSPLPPLVVVKTGEQYRCSPADHKLCRASYAVAAAVSPYS